MLPLFVFAGDVVNPKGSKEKLVPVVVPQKNALGIDAGEVISQENMSVRKLSSNSLPPDYVSARDFDKINGKTVKNFVESGKPLTYSNVAELSMQPEIDYLQHVIEELKKCKTKCSDKFHRLMNDHEANIQKDENIGHR
jgi:Flp pilus assembly protein CpaB